MIDLYRLLAEHPPEVLRVIAEQWQVSLWESDTIGIARRLGDAMLASGALERRIAGLSAAARTALYTLAREGGMASSKSLALRFGGLRRIGPSALERERPWAAPVSPIEELFYAGLVYRGFGAVPGGHGELLLLPRELQERLPRFHETDADIIETAPEPTAPLDDGVALSEDGLAILSFLRRARPLAADIAHSQLPAWLAVNGPLAGRLLGEVSGPRLALLWRLLRRMGLIETQDGRLVPSLAARDWLRARDVSRAARLYRAWRDDTSIDDLSQVPGLSCDPNGCPHDPKVARANLAAFLKRLTPGQWYTADGLLEALKRQRPTFLRPDGDMVSWLIRDSASGQYLQGPQSWKQVEGRLALYLLSQPLRWLGLVSVSIGTDGVKSLRLTTLGAAILGSSSAPSATRPSPLAQVEADGTIRVALTQSAYERYQLERIATWQSQSDVALYRLSDESVWEGYNGAITVPQMLAFLKRISGDRVPASLALTMQAWGGRFGRATLRQATLLVLADEHTASDIQHDRRASAMIAEALTPTILVVRPEAKNELTELLKAKGIWPRIITDSPAPSADPEH